MRSQRSENAVEVGGLLEEVDEDRQWVPDVVCAAARKQRRHVLATAQRRRHGADEAVLVVLQLVGWAVQHERVGRSAWMHAFGGHWGAAEEDEVSAG